MKDLFDDNDIVTKKDFSYSNANADTSIPVEIPFDENLHSFYQNSGSQPREFAPRSAGFVETTKTTFEETNEFYSAVDHNAELYNIHNPLDDNVSPNWKPTDDADALEGLDKRYYGYVLGATGPLEQKRRIYNALEQQRKAELISNGSFMGMMTGGALAFAFSPSSWIPIAGTVKYAKASAGVLSNLAKVAPGIALQSATHNAFIQSTKIGGNLEDFAVDSFRDTVAGLAFMGAGFGLGHAWEGGKFWNARHAVNMAYDGIDAMPIIAKDGSVTGYKAIAQNQSVSAAKVDFAQQFLDSKMAQNGLFAVPHIGGWIGKGAGKINPIVRMLNSPFTTMQGFIDRVADHGLVTQSIEKGVPSPDKFEVKMATLQGDNKQMFYTLKGLHLERNGIETSSRIVGNVKKLKEKWSSEDYVSEEQFGSEIRDVLLNENPSAYEPVNAAARLLRDHMDTSYKNFREAYGLSEAWLPPKTAEGYLNRVYDIGNMKIKENEWNSTITEWLSQADAEIAQHMAPIHSLEEEYRKLNRSHQEFIKTPNLTSEEIKTSADEVLALRRKWKTEESKLQDRMRADPALRMHVDDYGALSGSESKTLKKLLKPLNVLKKELKSTKSEIDKIKFELLKANGAAAKAKTKDTATKYLEQAAALEKQIPALENKLHISQNKHDLEYVKLQDLAADGKIDPILFYKPKGSNQIKFKNPNDRLKFRKEYESNYHRQNAAKAYYDTILNQTAEDTIGQVMGKLLGRISENPLSERTLMIPDHVLYENGFLSNDLAINVMNYRNALGRREFLKTSFNDVSLDGGIEPIATRLSEEFNEMKQGLNKKLAEAKTKKDKSKIEKEINTLQKQFNEAKQDMKLSYEKMMGRTRGSEKMRKFANISRSFAAAVRLGAVPLTMVTDTAAIVYKHGFWPSIRDGFLPMMENLGGMLNTPKGKAIRENAAHAHLGWNHVLSAYSDRNWGGTAQPFEPISGSLTNGMEKLAHISGNIAGTNYIENGLQRATAAIVQSKVMKYMLDFQAGKLAAKDKQTLLIYGLDPEKWSNRFIDGWKQRGKDGNGFGGYQSRYWEWGDMEAANKMSESIMRATRDTIIRKGMFDAPFFLDDPVASAILTFKGWTFASLTRYLMPLMQQPDGQKLLGTMFMLSAGALIDPLRRLTRGEDPIQDDDHMFWQALSNSGIFSSVTDVMEDVNVLTGGTLLKNIKNDRHKDRTLMGVIGGPMGGIGEDLYRILGMVSSGEYNQNDVNKMARLVPFTQAWYLRGLSNKMVESLELPQTRTQAATQNG